MWTLREPMNDSHRLIPFLSKALRMVRECVQMLAERKVEILEEGHLMRRVGYHARNESFGTIIVVTRTAREITRKVRAGKQKRQAARPQ